jgi:hypothetical protein
VGGQNANEWPKLTIPPDSISEQIRPLGQGGQMRVANSVLDAAGQETFQRELEELYASHNLAKDGTLYLEPEYLEAIATRK